MGYFQLSALPVDAISLTARFYPGEGWRLTVASWVTGAPIGDHDVEMYNRLSTAELLDVICEDAHRRLTAAGATLP